jgi:hypothetical protein
VAATVAATVEVRRRRGEARRGAQEFPTCGICAIVGASVSITP